MVSVICLKIIDYRVISSQAPKDSIYGEGSTTKGFITLYTSSDVEMETILSVYKG
jgi:hypothetical protein